MADEAPNGGKSHLHRLNNVGGRIDYPYHTSSCSSIIAIHSQCMEGLTALTPNNSQMENLSDSLSCGSGNKLAKNHGQLNTQ